MKYRDLMAFSLMLLSASYCASCYYGSLDIWMQAHQCSAGMLVNGWETALNFECQGILLLLLVFSSDTFCLVHCPCLCWHGGSLRGGLQLLSKLCCQRGDLMASKTYRTRRGMYFVRGCIQQFSCSSLLLPLTASSYVEQVHGFNSLARSKCCVLDIGNSSSNLQVPVVPLCRSIGTNGCLHITIRRVHQYVLW